MDMDNNTQTSAQFINKCYTVQCQERDWLKQGDAQMDLVISLQEVGLSFQC